MTSFSYNFAYNDWSNYPDSILIILQSSPAIGSIQSGSTLIVDSLGLSGFVGIDEKNSLIRNIRIFPQPALDELFVNLELNKAMTLKYEVADITGKVCKKGNIISSYTRIDIAGLNRGTYLLALRDSDGAIIHTSRLSVVK
jgi:hypothetical protein